jgi:SprT protein
MRNYLQEAVNVTQDYINKANSLFNLNIKDIEILFNIRGETAGQTYKNKIRYNKVLLKENYKHFIRETIPHETAHLIEFHLYGKAGHKENWKNIMKAFGFENPPRCHTYNTRNCHRNHSQYVYSCECSKTGKIVGSKVHKDLSIEKRYYFSCKMCKSMLKLVETYGDYK